MAEPVGCKPHVRDADEAPERPPERAPGHELGDGRRAPVRVHVEIEHLLPHRREEHDVPLLPRVLLRDLQLDRLVGPSERREERRRRLPHLEVDRAVFHLQDDVGVELAVEHGEVVVGRLRAIVRRIAPVHVVVVHEPAVEQHAVVRRECPRDDVGRVGVRAPIRRRTETPFGIGLEHEPAQIGNGAVDGVGAGAPPGGDTRIERVERIESPEPGGAAEIDRHGEADAVGAERVRDARKLRQKRGHQHPRVGVHVVDRAAVDADRRQQTRVGARAGEVAGHGAVGEEDRSAGVPALDRSIEVVPVVHPPDRSGRALRPRIESRRRIDGELPHQRERTVQHTAGGQAGDEQRSARVLGNPEVLGPERARWRRRHCRRGERWQGPE